MTELSNIKENLLKQIEQRFEEERDHYFEVNVDFNSDAIFVFIIDVDSHRGEITEIIIEDHYIQFSDFTAQMDQKHIDEIINYLN